MLALTAPTAQQFVDGEARFASLINIAVDREVIPEFIQTRFKDKLISDAAELRLTDASVLAAQLQGQRDAIRIMAGTGRPSAEIAAETILGLSGK